MSIHILIDEHVAKGNLLVLHPSSHTISVKRILYLSPSLMDFVGRDDFRAGKLLQELESFIAGEIVSISMIPRKAKKAMMGLLAPIENGNFDYRSKKPRPGLRVIGGFVKRDYFIALGLHVRSKMDEEEWRATILAFDLAWGELFKNNLPMMTGVNPSDYLSNCFCVDLV